MTLSDWLAHATLCHQSVVEMGLDRIQNICAQTRWHEFTCPVITVAGTNGKGSTVAVLESILSAAGYQTASYTSPHLLTFNERIRLSGKVSSDVELCRAFGAVEEARQGQPLTFFEFSTLAALFCFQQFKPDIVILEVGLGGRLDAVNCVDADVVVISTIDIDHSELLGLTRETIGFEKAGVFRQGSPVVCGDPNPPSTMLQQAEHLMCEWFQLGKDFSSKAEKSTWQFLSPSLILQGLPYPKGLALSNCASAIAALERLSQKLPITDSAFQAGLENVALAGRIQYLEETDVETVVDVSHNPQSCHRLAEHLQENPRRRNVAVLAMLKDKDGQGCLKPFVACIDTWYVADASNVQYQGRRGCKVSELQSFLIAAGVTQDKIYHCGSVEEAYQQAVSEAQKTDRIVAFGSFHSAAEVIRYTNFIIGD